MGLGDGTGSNEIFSGLFFQDMAKNSKSADGFDLVSIFAPLLDADMLSHKVNSDIHASRVDELLAIEKRIKSI